MINCNVSTNAESSSAIEKSGT